MNLKRIITIFRKDMQSSIRNAEILIALVVPLGLGLLYNTILPDTTKLPEVTLAYSAGDASRLPGSLSAVTSQTVRLKFMHLASATAVRRDVDREKAGVGLVIPAGFDRALRNGTAPQLRMIVRDGADTNVQYVAAAVEPAARHLTRGKPLLSIKTDLLPAKKGSMTQIAEEVGARSWGVLAAMVMLIAMTSMYIVPLILTEEAEKKTLDALAMIASYAEVIAAKALVGLAYVAIAIPILLVMTHLAPEDFLRFGLGMGLLAVTLVGLGLLIGGLFRTSKQVETWAMLLLLPLVVGAFGVGYNAPRALEIFFAIMPSSHAVQLATDGLAGKSLYGNSWISVLVILAWGVAAYVLLWWRLQRREA